MYINSNILGQSLEEGCLVLYQENDYLMSK